MASRASWKGFLVLARVGCPVRLHPATIRADRIGFQALNRATLNRVQMRPHDPQTGKEVSRDFVVRGYEAEPGQFVLVEDRELIELQIESSHSLILERLVERSAIDDAFIDASYFLVPDGRGADRAYGLIREAVRRSGLIAVTRIVLGGRERAALLEPRGKGMLLVTLRAAHEVRGDDTFFAEIDAAPPDEAMLALAERVVVRLVGGFDPRHDFRDRYQEALFHFVQAKRRGDRPVPPRAPTPAVLIDLRDALERSVAAEDEPKPPMPSRRRAPRRARKREEQSG